MTSATVSTRPPLVGRTRELDEIVSVLRSARRTPVLLVTGPPGAGRTALLDEAALRCTESRVGLLRLRSDPEDVDTPYGLLYRLASDLDRMRPAQGSATARAGSAGRSRHELPDTILAAVGAQSDDANSMLPRLVAALATALASVGPLAVLIDDAQWADPASVAVLTMFRTRVTSVARLVLTLPTGAEPTYRELIGSGTARMLSLRPLGRAEVAEVVASRCGATPEPDLVDTVHRAARGIAGATVDVIDSLLAGGSVHVVHGHAVLSREPEQIVPVRPTPLLAPLRGRGPRHWAVATGLAVLEPLGADAIGVLAEELGLPVEDVVAVLDALTAERILARGSDTLCWTFQLPVMAAALAARVGPARSRALAGLAAARALAAYGTTPDSPPPTDPFLADLVARAGTLVDPGPAVSYLLAAAGGATAADATRWYHAAIDLTSDPARRDEIRLDMIRTGIEGGQWTETAARIRDALAVDDGRRDEAEVVELMVVAATAAAATADEDELRRIVADRQHGPAAQAGAAALVHLGRFGAADRVLIANRPVDGVPGELRRRLTDIVDLALGRPARPAKPSLPSLPARVRAEAVRHDHAMACLRGDLPDGSATRVMPHPEIAVLAHYLTGNWDDALRTARVVHARSTGTARSPLPATVYWRAAQICALRGEFGIARDWAELGQGIGAHLLAVPRAYVLTSTGDHQGARALLGEALAAVRETGIRHGLEEILGALVDVDVAAGDVADAHRHGARLDELAGCVETDRAELLALLARATTDHDPTAATAAVTLARRRAQPAELASTLLVAAKAGLRPTALLGESYELFGGLDALACRAEVRAVLRDISGSVPRRDHAAEEQTRLLMRLVADGLSNRQVAAVLRTTAKAVEGQLGRLFARTGLRSRVELTTALLAGDVSELLARAE